MKLFTRQRPAPSPRRQLASWELDCDGVQLCPGYLMDDDGCASDNAYGAQFWHRDAVATLTCWVYPRFAAPEDPDNFSVGYRWEYEVGWCGEKVWRAAQLATSTWFFTDLADADAHAGEIAAALVTADPRSVVSAAPGRGSDWDGTPW